MVYKPIQSVSAEELVDFEYERSLFKGMLDRPAEKQLMFVQAPGMCGKTSLLHMMRFQCELEDIPCCQIDFRGQPYDNPHFTLAYEICEQLGLLPDCMAKALQPLSTGKPVGAEAATNIGGDVTNSYVITQVLTTVNITHDDLRPRHMRDRLIRAFADDLSNFAAQKGGVVCLFDTLEDISIEEENWLLEALLWPIAGGKLKDVIVVAAGRSCPMIDEPSEWKNFAHLIEKLPPMSVEHLKIYAQKVGVEITDDEQAKLLWRACRCGNPLFMGMLIKNLKVAGKAEP
jgi:hypothetical protein